MVGGHPGAEWETEAIGARFPATHLCTHLPPGVMLPREEAVERLDRAPVRLCSPPSSRPPTPAQICSDSVIPWARSRSGEFNLPASPLPPAPPGGRSPSRTCVRARTPVLSLSPSQNTSSRLSSASAQRPPRTQTITTNSWRCLLWVTVDWEEKPPGLLDSIHSHQSCSITLSVYLVPALHADPSGGCFPV